jgi:hypothetical protein
MTYLLEPVRFRNMMNVSFYDLWLSVLVVLQPAINCCIILLACDTNQSQNIITERIFICKFYITLYY